MQPELFSSDILVQQRRSDAALLGRTLARAKHPAPEEVAERVLERYRTAARALSAQREDLLAIPGMSEAAVETFEIVRDAAVALLRQDVLSAPLLSSWSALLNYVQADLANRPVEQVRVLYLDRKNRLIADEVSGTGTVDHVPLYPREVVKRALLVGASAFIIVHNHPSGDPTPSQADIAMTRQLSEAATALGLVLHDHLIVSQTGNTSFRSAGLL